jgi:hypothetical protein
MTRNKKRAEEKIGSATIYFLDGGFDWNEIGCVAVGNIGQNAINSRCPYFFLLFFSIFLG